MNAQLGGDAAEIHPLRPIQQRPRVIAHRGASALAPENTLLAFRLASESGAEMIETDAHLTRDGQIVLIHDADLGRTTNCSGIVGELHSQEIAACDAGYWFTSNNDNGHPYRGLGLGVPTLGDLLVALDAANSAIHVNPRHARLRSESPYRQQARRAAPEHGHGKSGHHLIV